MILHVLTSMPSSQRKASPTMGISGSRSTTGESMCESQHANALPRSMMVLLTLSASVLGTGCGMQM